MFRKRFTSLNPRSNFWVLLRILPTSSAKLVTLSTVEGLGSHQFVSSFHTSSISEPMSYSLCKYILFGSFSVRNLSPISENPRVLGLRWMSSCSKQQSSTVSYLVKSVGFSPETALTVSKHVSFKHEKADKVINLFKDYGFSEVQISKLVRIRPKVLSFDAKKNILPKFEFLRAKGISGPEMAKTLSSHPALLTRSLSKQIMASYDFLRNFFQSDEKLIAAVKQYPDILSQNIKIYVSPKIDILREHGVPDSSIATLIHYAPKSLVVIKSDRFREIVEKVEDMGFPSSKIKFVLAVQAFLKMSDSTWKSKVDAYTKWGWSEKDVLEAFQKHPWCMMYSEDKIMAGMNFFINKMGSRPSHIVDNPKLLSLSLEKRLIPRALVLEFLLSKGLVKKKISLAVLFDSPEKKFLQNFVRPYEKEAPEVLKLYKEKLNLSNGPLDGKL